MNETVCYVVPDPGNVVVHEHTVVVCNLYYQSIQVYLYNKNEEL